MSKFFILFALDSSLPIYTKHDVSLSQLLDIQSKLEDLFKKEIDLAILNKIDPIYGHQALDSGRLLFSHDPRLLIH